jgi:hypothetical protein
MQIHTRTDAHQQYSNQRGQKGTKWTGPNKEKQRMDKKRANRIKEARDSKRNVAQTKIMLLYLMPLEMQEFYSL